MNTSTVTQPSPGGQRASNSLEENSQLCWKCQALLNSRYPEGVVITETNETQREPEKKQIRQIKTLDLVESTARKGCPLCLQLLHSLSIPMRAVLRQHTETAKDSLESCGLVNEQDLFLSEGHPPSLSLHVVSNEPNPMSKSEEIGCLMQLYPTSGKFWQRSSLGNILINKLTQSLRLLSIMGQSTAAQIQIQAGRSWPAG
jgi:hypothetical protein